MNKRRSPQVYAYPRILEILNSSISMLVNDFTKGQIKASIHVPDKEECKKSDYYCDRLLTKDKEFILKLSWDNNKSEDIPLGRFPVPTDIGTFIINGKERVLLPLIRNSPGLFFSREGDKVKTTIATIRPRRGDRLEFMTVKGRLMVVLLGEAIPLIPFLKVAGWEDVLTSVKAKDTPDSNDKAEGFRTPPLTENAIKHIEYRLYQGTKRKNSEKITSEDICRALGHLLFLLFPDDFEGLGKGILKWDNEEEGYDEGIYFFRDNKKDRVSATFFCGSNGHVLHIVVEKDKGQTLLYIESRKGVNTAIYGFEDFLKFLRSKDILSPDKDSEDILTILKGVNICTKNGNLDKTLKGVPGKTAEVETNLKNHYIGSIWNKLFYRKTKPDSIEEQQKQIRERLARIDLDRIGRWQLNRRLYIKSDYPESADSYPLTQNDVIEILKNLTKNVDLDNPLHLANHEVALIDRLYANRLYVFIENVKKKIKEVRSKFNSIEDIRKLFDSYFPPNTLSRLLRDIISGKDQFAPLSHILPDTNELARAQLLRRISFFGPGGIDKEKSFHILYKRDFHYSHLGRLCPLHTLTKEKTGLVLHLAEEAMVDDLGQIKTPYYQVNNGKLDTFHKLYLTPLQEECRTVKENKWIAYGDQIADTSFITNGQVLARCGYKTEKVNITDISFVETSSYQIFSLSARHLPFLEHNHANRALFAAQGLAQAVCLKEPDGDDEKWRHSPLITTDYHDSLNIPGCNILTAVMPYYGWTFEDGIVVSQKVVDKGWFTSVHAERITLAVKRNGGILINGKEEELVVKEIKICVKQGDTVKKGAPLFKIHHEIKAHRSADEWIDLLCKALKLKELYEVNIPEWIPEATVKNIFDSQKKPGTLPKNSPYSRVINIDLRAERPLTLGDKLFNRHGGKGVICKILPEHEMPYFTTEKRACNSDFCEIKENHCHVETLLNPIGILNRMNIGTLYEMEATGINFGKKEVVPFKKKSELNAGETRVEVCIPAKPDSISHKVPVGYLYTLKSGHMAERKWHVRAMKSYSDLWQEPPKSGKRADLTKITSGQRMGEMELWTLLAHGATGILEQNLTIQSNDKWDRDKVIPSLRTDKTVKTVKREFVPESLINSIPYYRALGMELEIYDKGGKKQEIDKSRMPVSYVKFRPINEGDIEKLSSGKLNNDILFQGPHDKEIKVSKNGKTEDTGLRGLFSQIVFGPEKDYMCLCGKYYDPVYNQRGNVCAVCGVMITDHEERKRRFGHISLEFPVINPLRSSEVLRVWENNRRLADITLEDGKCSADFYLEVGQKLDVSDAFFIKDILVLPPAFRTNIFKTNPIDEPINEAYRKIILFNRLLGEQKGIIIENRYEAMVKIAKVTALEYLRKLQKWVDRLFGRILDEMKGKKGVLRKHVYGRRLDFSGRAVIVCDPELEINQCRLPVNIALELYKPLVAKSICDDSGNGGFYGAQVAKINTLLKTPELVNDEDKKKIIQCLKKCCGKYPVLLNRQPTLHQHSILAFYPKLREDDFSVIGVHPLVTKGFGADFDGDQMAVYLPLPLNSVPDEIKKLLPENNMFNAGSGDVAFHLGQDIALGAYLGRKNVSGSVLPTLKDTKPFSKWVKDNLKDGKGLKWISKCCNEAFDNTTRYAPPLGLDVKKDSLKEFIDSKAAKEDSLNAIYVELGKQDFLDKRLTEIKVSGNLLNGLTLADYIATCHHVRAKQVETGIVIARTGDFMRRLIFGCQGAVVVESSKCSGPVDSTAGSAMAILSCKEHDGNICTKCYGEGFEPGYPAGIIAAQSLGERLSQGTLKAKHVAGEGEEEKETKMGLDDIIRLFDNPEEALKKNGLRPKGGWEVGKMKDDYAKIVNFYKLPFADGQLLKGVSERHLGVILRQMCGWVELSETGEVIHIDQYDKMKEGKNPDDRETVISIRNAAMLRYPFASLAFRDLKMGLASLANKEIPVRSFLDRVFFSELTMETNDEGLS